MPSMTATKITNGRPRTIPATRTTKDQAAGLARENALISKRTWRNVYRFDAAKVDGVSAGAGNPRPTGPQGRSLVVGNFGHAFLSGERCSNPPSPARAIVP